MGWLTFLLGGASLTFCLMSVWQLLRRRREQPPSISLKVHLTAWITFWAFWSLQFLPLFFCVYQSGMTWQRHKLQSCDPVPVLPLIVPMLAKLFPLLSLLGFFIAWKRKEVPTDSQLALAAIMFVGILLVLWSLPDILQARLAQPK